MPSPTLSAEDGVFSDLAEVEGSGLKKYPFSNRQVKDVTTYIRQRIYEIARASYTPAAASLADVDDAAALLLEEGEPSSLGGDLIRVERFFGPVPTAQVSMDLKSFSRPALHDLKATGGLGTVWAVSFDDLATSTLFFDQKDATIGAITPAGATEAIAANALPSATVTIGKIAGGTTTFSTTDSASSIQSTLAAALGSNVYVVKAEGNIVCTGTSLATTVKYVSVSPETGLEIVYDSDGTGATPANLSVRATNQTNDINPDTPTNIRTVTSTSSGAAAGDLAVLWLADKIIAISKVLTIPTGNTFTVAADQGLLAVGSVVITKCQFAKNGLRLVNGNRKCSVRSTENYYRAGTTTGITSLADVPATTTYEDALGWFGRIVASTLTSVTCATATNRFSKTAHGLNTGDTIFLLAKTGGSSLVLLQQYWVIKVDADLFKVATSPALALAGTAQAVGSDGTGITVLVPDPWPEIFVSEFKPYMGPVVYKTTDEVQMADALETRTAAA